MYIYGDCAKVGGSRLQNHLGTNCGWIDPLTKDMLLDTKYRQLYTSY